MASPASIKKHPIHPMLIVFPIALFIFSFIADIIYVMAWGRSIWYDIALYTMAGGIIGALLAAMPGFIDYLSITEPRAKRTATAHMVINLIVVAIFALSLYLHISYPPGEYLPIVLSGIGVFLMAISGWLGGELVYVMGVSVEPHPSDKTVDRYDEKVERDRDRRVA